MASCARQSAAVEDATAKKIFADALEEIAVDAKGAEPDAAQRGAGGDPGAAGTGACLAAEQQHWHEALRTRT